MRDNCVCDTCTLKRIEGVIGSEPGEASLQDGCDQVAEGNAVVHDCAGAA